MRRVQSVPQRMRQVRQQVERAVRTAAAAPAGRTVNIARRTNLVIRANVGEHDVVHGATASQDAPVSQSGDGAKQKEV